MEVLERYIAFVNVVSLCIFILLVHFFSSKSVSFIYTMTKCTIAAFCASFLQNDEK